MPDQAGTEGVADSGPFRLIGGLADAIMRLAVAVRGRRPQNLPAPKDPT